MAEILDWMKIWSVCRLWNDWLGSVASVLHRYDLLELLQFDLIRMIAALELRSYRVVVAFAANPSPGFITVLALRIVLRPHLLVYKVFVMFHVAWLLWLGPFGRIDHIFIFIERVINRSLPGALRVEIVWKFNLIDALKLAAKTEWTSVLLHTLVIVVEASDGEIARLRVCSWHHNAFASTKAWCSNFDFFLRVIHKLFVGVSALLDHASTATL